MTSPPPWHSEGHLPYAEAGEERDGGGGVEGGFGYCSGITGPQKDCFIQPTTDGDEGGVSQLFGWTETLVKTTERSLSLPTSLYFSISLPLPLSLSPPLPLSLLHSNTFPWHDHISG